MARMGQLDHAQAVLAGAWAWRRLPRLAEDRGPPVFLPASAAGTVLGLHSDFREDDPGGRFDMALTIVAGLAFFVGMMAILYFGHEQAEKDRAERAEAEALRGQAEARQELRTADEVVFDLEHRIDSDLQEFSASLRRQAPGVDSPVHQA